jgi:HK97 family phage portal protein
MPWQWPWRRTQDRALWSMGDLSTPATAAGEPVTVDSSLRLSAVWGCVRLLSDSVATLPVDVYRTGERTPLPTPPLLQRPSADFPELTDWLWAAMASLLLRGNAWGRITARAGAGLLPAQVDLVHPDHVSVNASEGQPVEIRFGGEVVDREDIWHVKAFAFPGSLVGLSPIAYARECIALGIAAEKFGARWFGEGAVPSGVIESDQKFGQERAEQLQAMWMSRHAGHRRPAVLSQAAYKPISVAPEESQFVESQKLNAAAICRLFGVPAGMMAGVELAGHEDYSSPEQRAQDFLTFGLRPWLTRLERGLSALLPRQHYARFNPGGLVRATLRERYEAHRVAIEAGFLTVNEVRELEDRPPLDEGGAVA